MNLTFYTDNLPPGVGGRANAFVIRIRPEYRNDKGLHAHEELHVKQWWAWVAAGVVVAWLAFTMGYSFWPYAILAGCMAHSLLYTLVPKYKLWSEVQCFKEQIKHYPDDRSLFFANYLASHYGLKITTEQAYKLLKES